MELDNFLKIVFDIVESEKILTITGAVISFIGVFIALSNARSVKKQADLLKSQENKKIPNLNVNIRDSYNVYNNKTDSLDYIFEILIKNNTDIDNSVTNIQLCIKHKLRNNIFFNVANYNKPCKINEKLIGSKLPYKIDSNSSDIVRCVFSFPYDEIMNQKIKNYTIRAFDTHDQIYEDTVIIVRGEFKYENI